MEFGFDGSNQGAAKKPATGAPEGTDQPDVSGMGFWLESDGPTVFRTLDNLVLRQELLAISRLQLDTYYTLVKIGYPFVELYKDQGKDTYRLNMPTGMDTLSVAAVPNQAWDLVNKATEAILADPPSADPEPLDDSEEAESAAQMAQRFLDEDAGENGTNDVRMMYNALDHALTCATTYAEYWTDPVGGGYVPLQIEAHPLAVSPDNPLVGPDGMPTPDNVLRYVTAPSGGQFTDDPTQAAPQWQPKVMVSLWGREHWRIFPESVAVEQAEKGVGILYCTLAQAKRRWPEVAQMGADQLNTLLSWTPLRYQALLPPFQRSRFRLSVGSQLNQSGDSDERILFYYQLYQRSCPDHPHGADVVCSGAAGGMIIHRDELAMHVEVPSEGHGSPKPEVRCMDLPVAQLTPRTDPDERDPTGRCYLQLFTGAVEFNAGLATGFMEALTIWLHPDSYSYGTSPVQGFQVAESRMTGDHIPIFRAEDKPTYGNMPPIPANFFEAWDRNDQAIKSIASLDKPVTGQQDPSKQSGKALQIAVNRAMVGLYRMLRPTNAFYERCCRLKLQQAMRYFTNPQLLRYVGEDGTYQAEEFLGIDFALVGRVTTAAGTGTMLDADAKVQYAANLAAEGFMDREEAAEAARKTYGRRLGLVDDPHQQHIERCVALWLDGPPPDQEGQVPWVQQWQRYAQLKPMYEAAQAEQAQRSQIAIAQPGAAPAPAAPLQPPPRPWTPFDFRPNDDEPLIAAKWMKRLSKVMSTVKYTAAVPEWRQVLDEAYTAARSVVAQAMPMPALPKGVEIRAQPADAAGLAADAAAALHGGAAPNAPQQGPPRGTQPQQARKPTPNAQTGPVAA